MLKRYYDRNTRLFLWLGGSRSALTIHRALWGPGVRTRQEALAYAHHLLLEQIHAAGLIEPRLLDLGCGVGGSLLSLLAQLSEGSSGTGVTLSPVQADLAGRAARERAMEHRAAFLEADFLCLPALSPVDFAYAIESFVLTAHPAAFFQQAAGVLRLGGQLVVIDDFLLREPTTSRESSLLAAFVRGWHAHGLNTPQQAIRSAALSGLTLLHEADLSTMVRVNTLRDRAVSAAVGVGRLLQLRGPYWDSLYGGDALRACLASGLTGYRMLVFEKSVLQSSPESDP